MIYILIGVYVVTSSLNFILRSDYSKLFWIPALWCIVFMLPFTLGEWTYQSLARIQFVNGMTYILTSIFTLISIRYSIRIIRQKILFRNITPEQFVNAHNYKLDNH